MDRKKLTERTNVETITIYTNSGTRVIIIFKNKPSYVKPRDIYKSTTIYKKLLNWFQWVIYNHAFSGRQSYRPRGARRFN